MKIRRRAALAGTLAAASLALAGCGAGAGGGQYTGGYVRAPADTPNNGKTQTPDIKGGNNGGGNSGGGGYGSGGFAEGFERGGSD